MPRLLHADPRCLRDISARSRFLRPVERSGVHGEKGRIEAWNDSSNDELHPASTVEVSCVEFSVGQRTSILVHSPMARWDFAGVHLAGHPLTSVPNVVTS